MESPVLSTLNLFRDSLLHPTKVSGLKLVSGQSFSFSPWMFNVPPTCSHQMLRSHSYLRNTDIIWVKSCNHTFFIINKYVFSSTIFNMGGKEWRGLDRVKMGFLNCSMEPPSRDTGSFASRWGASSRGGIIGSNAKLPGAKKTIWRHCCNSKSSPPSKLEYIRPRTKILL